MSELKLYDSKPIASIEAEEALLASIMIDPACIIEVDSILKGDGDFFLLANRVVYMAMQRIKSRKDEIDMITLADDLEKTGDLETIGGRVRLMQIANSEGTSTRVSVYADMVARAAIRRRMLEANDAMRKIISDETLNIDDVQALSDTAWLEVTSDITKNNGQWFGEILSELYDEIEKAMMNPKTIAGISTGLTDVDALTQGFSPEQLIILAGRPGMGKSAAMDNMALSMAKAGVPVFYPTSERSKMQVVRRMAAIHIGISTEQLTNGKLTPQEAHRLTKGIGEIHDLPIYIEDSPMPRPRDIYAQADWMVKRHGCKIVLFDGMYRAKTGIDKIDTDDRKKYGTIALELKTMARSLGVPVVATHQLNREVEKRQNKRPMMSDLRESGRIEEEADKIIFLYRDEEYNPATEFPNQCDWILAKHRDGGTGIVSTYYDKNFTRFGNTSVHRVDLSDLE